MSVCLHRDTHFDRSLCACGAMHTYCNDCGHVVDNCPYDDSPYDKHKPDPSPAPSSRPDTRYEIGVLVGPCSEPEATALMEEVDEFVDQRLGGITSLVRQQSPDTLTAREHAETVRENAMSLFRDKDGEQWAEAHEITDQASPDLRAARDVLALLAEVERLECERDEWKAEAKRRAVWHDQAEALAERRAEALRDEIEMAEQSLVHLRDLQANWRVMVDEKNYDGECVIDEILRSLIDDVTPEMMRAALADGGQENHA